MKNIIIRQAKLKDYKQIKEIANIWANKKYYNHYLSEWLSFPFNKSHYIKYKIKNTFIAIKKDRILGYFDYTICDGFVVIDHFVIRGRYRKSGIGSKLLNYFIDFCKEKKYKKIEVYSWIPLNSWEFYVKNGFKKRNKIIDGSHFMVYKL